MRNKPFLLLLFALISKFTAAQHTFSICAVDTVTGEVGSAGASCIGHSVIISDVHPGLGVIHTQAAYQQVNQDIGRELMDNGLLPQQIIDSLVAGDFIFGAPTRQYGAVGIYNGSPIAAGYTGPGCMDYKNHIVGRYYTIQGNILLGQGILDSMESRFLHTEGNLACRLMAAIQGAKVIGADTRCTGSGSSSLSSFLRVALPTDSANSPYINIIIDSGPVGYEPIDSLQTLFDQIKYCGEDTGTAVNAVKNPLVKVTYDVNENSISVHANIKGDFLFALFDTSGKMVLSKSFAGSTPHSLLLKQASPGVYVWHITENTKVHTGKIVIESMK